MGDRKIRFPGWLQVAAFLSAAVSAIATQSPRQPRNYPAWEFAQDRTRSIFGLDAKLWVSKSGKSGIGITFRLGNSGSAAAGFSLTSAQFSIGETTFNAQDIPTEVTVEPLAAHHLYILFVFDNENFWNDSERKGTLSLRFIKDREEVVWRADLEHHLRGFHRTVPEECIYETDKQSEEADPIQKTYDESNPCKEKIENR